MNKDSGHILTLFEKFDGFIHLSNGTHHHGILIKDYKVIFKFFEKQFATPTTLIIASRAKANNEIVNNDASIAFDSESLKLQISYK